MADRDKNDIRKRLEELRKDNNRQNNRQNNNKSPFSGFLFFVFVFLLFVFTLIFQRDIQTYFLEKRDIPYTEFVSRTQKGDFPEISEKDDKLIAQVKENGKDVLYYTKKITERVGNEPKIINAVEQKKSKIKRIATIRWRIIFDTSNSVFTNGYNDCTYDLLG